MRYIPGFLSLAACLTTCAGQTFRVATFNTSLNRSSAGALIQDLKTPESRGTHQIKQVAEVLQTIRPDIIFLNEVDFDDRGEALRLFQENFLNVSQGGKEPLDLPYRFTAPSNTGIPSNLDLDHNGRVGKTVGEPDYAGDAYGFGQFPGQYGMAMLSRFPLKANATRTFQKFTWKAMPDALLPESFYTEAEAAAMRLSSKSHWDVPVDVAGQTVHLLLSHPTPPVFDGPEDRNGRRNHDEIRFWADFIDPQRNHYHVDDDGQTGGLAEGSRFIIMGDLNADPNDGDSLRRAARQLTEHPLIQNDFVPRNATAKVDAAQKGDPRDDTAHFRSGDLRVDYVLPSSQGLKVVGGAVHWPPQNTPEGAVVTSASDHRLVYLDLEIIP